MAKLFIGVALSMLATPAWAGSSMFAVTPNGQAEVIFPSSSAKNVSGRLAARCIALGASLASSTENEVTCEFKMSAMKSALTQMLIGNSYSTSPRQLVKFSLAEIGDNTVGRAEEWVETQMAFGQNRRQSIDGDVFHNSAMEYMTQCGGLYPFGTSFPNHAYLGIGYNGSVSAKYNGKATIGLTITTVSAGMPFEKAGGKVGDVIVALNNKTFKNAVTFSDDLKGIPVGKTFDVAVLRDGNLLTLPTVSIRRDPVSEAEFSDLAKKVRAALPPSHAPATQSLSVADELTKLAALKEKGVLTDAEFQAQKAALLSAHAKVN